MKNFQLLKQTFPVSEFDRECDGYKFIMDKLPKEVREKLGIDDNKLQKIIKKGEKYMYRVGKEEGVFHAMTISLSNFEIIRKYIFVLTD
jgi:bifunctional DNA-binding transcriptional regulator/antitoxin component of YhaV-PrlF toxin-antitoxin module